MFRKPKANNNFPPTKPSSEELFIQNYFGTRGISFIPEFSINNLIDDKKSYRRIDFYLPKFGVYVEHFGWYNKDKEKRAAYDEKARVLIKNNLPVVILYPHELGFLDYAFHIKMLKVLRVPKFKNNFKTFHYKLVRYISIGRGYYFFMSLFIFLLTFQVTMDDNLKYNLVLAAGLSVSFALMFLFFRNIVRIFFYDD